MNKDVVLSVHDVRRADIEARSKQLPMPIIITITVPESERDTIFIVDVYKQ